MRAPSWLPISDSGAMASANALRWNPVFTVFDAPADTMSSVTTELMAYVCTMAGKTLTEATTPEPSEAAALVVTYF